MGKAGRLHRIVRKGGSWVFLSKVLLSLVAVVFAASISVTSTTYQAEVGSAVNVANGLVGTDKGFSISLVGSAATSCSSPVTFGPVPGTANTTITGGHLVYDIQVNSTTLVSANTKFNATLVIASTTYGPVCVQTPAVPVNGQTIDCKFDVGTALPASPYSFKVTVQ